MSKGLNSQGWMMRRGAAAFAVAAGVMLAAFAAPEPGEIRTSIEPWEDGLYVEAALAGTPEPEPTLTAVERLRQAGFDGEGIVRDLLRAGVPARAVRLADYEAGELSGNARKERLCLAQAIYYEARNQPVMGRLAVADVVLNRVDDERFPDTICGVVFQGAEKRRGCQFSFACDGSMKRSREARSWSEAEHLADVIYRGFRPPLTRFATFYHADYVAPYWAKVFDETTVIGDHIFYRPPGALKLAASRLGLTELPARS